MLLVHNTLGGFDRSKRNVKNHLLHDFERKKKEKKSCSKHRLRKTFENIFFSKAGLTRLTKFVLNETSSIPAGYAILM